MAEPRTRSFAVGLTPVAIAVGAIAVAAVIVVAIISSALNSIFRVAVYQYAATGQVPAAFDSGLVQSAFGGAHPPGLTRGNRIPCLQRR